MNKPTKIKICGITNQKDLQAAIKMGADYTGFVTGVTSSPRNLSLEKAEQLIHGVNTTKTVLVLVPRDTNAVLDIYERVKPDYLQIHGDLSLYKELEEFDIPVIIGVNSEFDEDLVVDLSRKFTLLIDTHISGMYGGTGVTHNWGKSRLIRERIAPGRLILAGGLTPQNVAEAVRLVEPYCVDVSSGVEAAPGVKDHGKLSAFIKAVREVDAAE